jgi:hypothetical protein
LGKCWIFFKFLLHHKNLTMGKEIRYFLHLKSILINKLEKIQIYKPWCCRQGAFYSACIPQQFFWLASNLCMNPSQKPCFPVELQVKLETFILNSTQILVQVNVQSL